MGVALPLAMVVLDPAVFRAVLGVDTPLLGAWKPLGYTGIALGVCAFAFQLLSKRSYAATAGALAAGSVFAGTLGTALLPFSLLGIVVLGIGLLGLTPFLSSVVFGRRAYTEYRRAAVPHRRLVACLAFLLFFGICASVQWMASSAVRMAIQDVSSSQPQRIEAGAASLARWRFLVDLDAMVLAWTSETDDARKRSLADAYQRLTGEDIARRANAMAD
jgi:hypothetical protein